MLRIFDVNYSLLSDNRSEELFSLRKKTFKDRLDWIVNCENNMEFDEYDNRHATYLFGIYDNAVITSIRFIEMKHHNMITGTFRSYFEKLEIPEGNFIDASRLFIDKERVKANELGQKPISTLMFLAMLNYARDRCYEGIYAIVSHPMMLIFKRSGWKVKVVEKGLSEKDAPIYLIFMPVDEINQRILIDRINRANSHQQQAQPLNSWPLTFNVRNHRPDELQLNTQSYGVLGVGHS